MRRLWAVAVVSVLLTITAAAAPANACGCGAVVPAPGETASVTSETAIVSFADGVQSIQLSLGVDSSVAGAGLIIPTPNPATVTAGDTALFADFAEQIAPRERFVDDWWGTMVDPAAAEPAVTSTATVGGLEATAFPASDSTGLGTWVQERGFALTPEISAQLGQYEAKGWFFVAVALGGEGTLDGQLDPILVSFPTSTLVYPLGLARANATEQALRIGIVSDHRVNVVRAGTSDEPLDAAQRVVWAGPVTRPALAALGSYLTVLDLRFDEPATQITTDIGMAFAPNDDRVSHTVAVVRPIELLGFPLGTLLAVWGGLGLAGLLGAVVARSRLR